MFFEFSIVYKKKTKQHNCDDNTKGSLLLE